MSSLSAIFLDRDGTLIEDLHYPREPERVVLLPGVVAGLKLLHEKGYTCFVVSNQSGVGRGIIKVSEYEAVHARVVSLLKDEGLKIAEYFYCLHRPEDNCECRKPKAAHIPKIFRGDPIGFASSFTVGDRDCDLFLGDTLGAKGLLVLTGKGRATLQELVVAGIEKRYPSFETLEEIAHYVPIRGAR